MSYCSIDCLAVNMTVVVPKNYVILAAMLGDHTAVLGFFLGKMRHIVVKDTVITT